MTPQRASAARFRAMTPQDIDAVLRIEQAAYEFPWSRGNFIDSLSAGHATQLMCHAQGKLLGYFVAMSGVEEMHLLNLTVAPDVQGCGHGRHLLGTLVQRCRSEAAHSLWLEVRRSNQRAQSIYEQFGFRACGLRKGYYPAAQGRREDAVVMSLQIASTSLRACNEVE